MSEKYEPKYKEGQLTVNFKKDIPGDFPEYLDKKLGYKIIEVTNSGYHIYDVGKNINKAIKEFENYEEFIHWTQKRDIRDENRSDFEYSLEDMVRSLDTELSINNFQKSLKDIIKYIKNFKD